MMIITIIMHIHLVICMFVSHIFIQSFIESFSQLYIRSFIHLFSSLLYIYECYLQFDWVKIEKLHKIEKLEFHFKN